MAEVAAGAGIALAAEEVLSTTAQAGVATYFLAKPTQPLKATFTRIAVADDGDLDSRSLTRSNHSLTIINDKAYIFGGETASSELATNDVHIINLAPGKNTDPDYQLIPAIKESGKATPESRSKHAACAFKGFVAVYGGCDSTGNAIEEGSVVRLYDPETKTWDILSPETSESTPGPRIGAKLFSHEDTLILYGGTTPNNQASSSLFLFNAQNYRHGVLEEVHINSEAEPSTSPQSWTRLPDPPVAASASNAAVHENNLYLISSTDPMSSQLHILPLTTSTSKLQDQKEERSWTTLTFPTNPLIPGPRARHGGALLPVTTGYGRNYLVYLMGAREQPSQIHSDSTTTATATQSSDAEGEITQWSDTWTLQLPSSPLSPHASLSLASALKPAKLKDAIRAGVGADSGKWSWAEVEVQVPDDLGAGMGVREGKLHPGPRAWFGADVMSAGGGGKGENGTGRSVVFWGGEGAGGERVGDGWVLRLE